MTSASGQQITRVVIADNEPWAISTIETLLTDPSIEIVGKCSTMQEAISSISALKPNVAIIDLDWPEDRRGGIHIMEQLGDVTTHVACFLLTYTEDFTGALVQSTFKAGARGAYRKGRIPGDKFREIIHALARGETRVEEELITKMLTDIGVKTITPSEIAETLPRLAPREREALALLNHGLSIKEAAKTMRIKGVTVKDYLDRARAKFGDRMNSYQLALFAGLEGWLRQDH